MTAAPLNFIIEAGATFTAVLTWEDPDENPIDITGYTAAMQIRPSMESEDVLADLTSSPAAGLTLGGTAGTIAIRIEADVTDAMPVGRSVYDLELTSGGDPAEVTRLVEGLVTVRRQVTR